MNPTTRLEKELADASSVEKSVAQQDISSTRCMTYRRYRGCPSTYAAQRSEDRGMCAERRASCFRKRGRQRNCKESFVWTEMRGLTQGTDEDVWSNL